MSDIDPTDPTGPTGPVPEVPVTAPPATASGTPPTSDADRISAWFAGRLPEAWWLTPPAVTVDRDEITVVIQVRTASGSTGATDGSGDRVLADEEAAGRVTRFREETRLERMRIAEEAERRYGRKVAWGASVGSVSEVFTNLAVPVMTRLRQPERLVLDTLVDSGVARSRAHALAWCVRLVGQHSGEWLGDLRSAMSEVERVRAAGPAA